MATNRRALIYRLVICCGLLLASMTIGAMSGRAAPARAGLSAHTFYAISAATYHNWCHDTNADACASPARVSRFPARVEYVAFYFQTNYPARNAGDMTMDVMARFGIAIYTSAGILYTRFANLGDQTQIGWQEGSAYFGDGFALIHAPQLAQDTTGSVYPDNTYRADLLIDGKVVAHTTFSVGSGRPAHPGQARPTIVAFYPTTEVAYSTWTDMGTIPAKATTVQGGTQVFFFLRWAHTPTTAPLSLGIADSGQHTLVAHTGLFTVPRASGYAIYIVVSSDGSAFNPGIYQGEVLLGDQVLAKTTFTVGVCTTCN